MNETSIDTFRAAGRPRRLPAGHRRGRRAHTLVELMVGVGLFSIVLIALLATRFGPAWAVFDPVAGESVDLGPIEQQLRKMVVEIQEGTRLFYPAAGKGSQEGLGLVNSRGETILYVLEPGEEAGAPGTLMRVNVNARQEGSEDSSARFLGAVRHLRVSVAPAAPGKEPSLVELDLAVEVLARSGKEKRLVNYVTSAFPRNREAPIPDDLFPAGTPLVDP